MTDDEILDEMIEATDKVRQLITEKVENEACRADAHRLVDRLTLSFQEMKGELRDITLPLQPNFKEKVIKYLEMVDRIYVQGILS